MHFRSLRVINEDHIRPGQGSHPYSHRDMEIITYVLSGVLEHQDSTGNGSIIRPGDLQRISGGTGITHSEFNHSKTEIVHLLQIWILPEQKGLAPGYVQCTFESKAFHGQWQFIAFRDGCEQTVRIHQDVNLYALILEKGQSQSFEIGPDRHLWLQLGRGEIQLNETNMKAGDGLGADGNSHLEIHVDATSELLLFDLA